MRFNVVILLFFLFNCWDATAQALSESELMENTLARVNDYRINNQNDSALYELIKVNQQAKKLGYESGYLYVEMGNIYFQLKLDNTARQIYLKALKLFRAQQDITGESIVLENLGGLHGRVEGNDSTFYYYNKALTLQQQAGDVFYAAHSQRALALHYSIKGDFISAKKYLYPAIQAAKSNAIRKHVRYKWDVQFIPQQVYLAGSDIFRNEEQFDSAEYYLQEAIRMTRIHGIAPHRVRYTTFLGTFYLEQKQYPKAYEAIKQALFLADSIHYVWGKVGALQALRNYYHQIKDAKKELEAAFNYLEYKDKMFNERNNDELIVMSNLVLQYENELEIERQQNIVKEKEKINALQQKQNYLLLGIVIVFAIAFVVIIYLYRSLRQKNKLVKQVSHELQVNNETMRMLLSVISHDLRSPFRSMMGLTKVTMMEQQLTAPELQERVVMMHDTASKGSILLDNLLQWVALQRDKVLIEKTTFSVEEVVNETLQELANLALTEKVTIEKQLYLNTFTSDRNGLKVIVRNLLTNAVKYSTNKKVILAIKAIDDNVFIHVTDQGPGIPEEILQNLFQQADMKTVAAKGGGLGMVIVKEMVTQLKGDIRAVNLPEGGARFEVRLPLQ